MPIRTLALILPLLLVGCSPFVKRVEVPVVQYVEVVKYVELPEEHLRACPITHGLDRSVKEYVRVANTNTPALEQCARQIEAIRKLQP